jgi:diguanylate cyclase (GGDEF)-like protein
MAGIGITGIIVVNTTAALVALSHGRISQASTNVMYLNFLSVTLVMLGMHLLLFEDVIEELRKAGAALRESRDEMRALAVTDPLTRCYNRRFLEEIETHELHLHRRYGLPLSLLYIDIDRFKTINDTLGHHTGDRVLQALAAILREHTRHSDYVLRWGGDEFLVLISAGETNARIKAQNIRQVFLESAIMRDLPAGVDLSIGCVGVPSDTARLAPLIEQADRDMYRDRREAAG